MKNNIEWPKRLNDELLDTYNTSGEATAVHIVRDIVKNINTKNKWIDVVVGNGVFSGYVPFCGKFGIIDRHGATGV